MKIQCTVLLALALSQIGIGRSAAAHAAEEGPADEVRALRREAQATSNAPARLEQLARSSEMRIPRRLAMPSRSTATASRRTRVRWRKRGQRLRGGGGRRAPVPDYGEDTDDDEQGRRCRPGQLPAGRLRAGGCRWADHDSIGSTTTSPSVGPVSFWRVGSRVSAGPAVSGKPA